MSDELPIYSKWEDIPEGIATKTTLGKEHGLKLAKDQKPVALKKAYNHRGKHIGYYDLYAISEAEPKKQATAAQLAALEKARHMGEKLILTCSRCDRVEETRYGPYMVTRKRYIEKKLNTFVCEICTDHDEAHEWAVNLLEYGDFLILDTETTDLYGEIIEIAVIDSSGKELLNQRIKPQGEISPGAYRVHSISMDDLQDKPSFADVYPQLKTVLKGRAVIIYNASYDKTCIKQDCERHNLKPIRFESTCAMTWYSRWVGDYSEYHGDYKYQSLNGGHSALSDCRATLAVIKEMAATETHSDAITQTQNDTL